MTTPRTLQERLAALPPEKRRLLEQQLKAQSARKPDTGIPRVAQPGERYPLSLSQEQLWLDTILNPAPALYNECIVLDLGGPLDVDMLRASLDDIKARHQVWRTRIVEQEGKGWQIVDAASPVPFVLHDLAGTPASEQDRALDELVVAVHEAPFDLAGGEVARATLVRLSAAKHVLIFAVHHIAFDGRSAALFAQELFSLYAARLARRPAALPEPAIQYADYAVWQRERAAGEQARAGEQAELDFWRAELDGAPFVLGLQTDRPRPRFRAGHGARVHFTIPAEIAARVRSFSRQAGVTPFMVLVACLYAVLRRHTAQNDMVIGTPVSVRDEPALENLIGPFLNTLCLRVRTAPDTTFAELVAHVREIITRAQAHRNVPFSRVLEAVRPPRDPSRTPIFQVMFNMYRAPAPIEQIGELSVKRRVMEHGTARFDLTLDVEETDTSLSGWWEYDTALFDAATIHRLAGHFTTLMAAAVGEASASSEASEPGRQHLSSLPLMSEAERQALIHDVNNTAMDHGPDACIHHLFEEQVARTPDAVAFISADPSAPEPWLRYQDIEVRANRLAHHLIGLGVGPDMIVGICTERSLDMVIGVLGVLKAGAAYLPLDPSYPRERLAFMVRDAGARVLVGDEALLAGFGRQAMHVPVHVWSQPSTAEAERAPQTAVTPENIAYVIYTSGSTGGPKGVLGLHRGIVNRFRWMWQTFPFAPGEVGCQKTALSFLDSAWEIFGTSLQGIPTVLIPDAVVKDPPALVALLAEHRVTRLVLVPSLLGAILDSNPDIGKKLAALRYCVTSGEALPIDVARRFMTALPGATLLNLYGSSEVSADASYWQVDVDDIGVAMPIGRPIANTQIHILDEHRQLVPLGVAGEVYIGGVGLARGYWQRPELTSERFIEHPLAGGPGALLHKTGDRARRRNDGVIEYLGRVDHQLKVRGYRIDPGEVEAALEAHAGVASAIVGLYEHRPGDRRLAAWLVAATQPGPGVPALRAHLGERLPGYMVPANFVFVDAMPLTPSGKVDRARLPAPDRDRNQSESTYQRPETELQRMIAAVWADKLGLDRVGIRDSFFDLGGDSLLLVDVYSELAPRVERELSMMELFRYPTIEALCRYLGDGNQAGDKPVERKPQRGRKNNLLARGRSTRRMARNALRQGHNLDIAVRTAPPVSLEACDALTETLLRAIWAGILDRPSMDIHPDDIFFASGGTPELAARVVDRMSRVFGIPLPARALFQAPTIRQMGLYIQAARREPNWPSSWDIQPAGPPAPGAWDGMLSPAQQNMAELAARGVMLPLLSVACAIDREGDAKAFDADALARSVQRLCARAPVLCARVDERGIHPGQPGQADSAMVRRVTIEHDSELLPALFDEVARSCEHDDTQNHHAMRVTLYAVSGSAHVVQMVFHPAVADLDTAGRALVELMALYTAEVQGKTAPEASATLAFGDIARFQAAQLTPAAADAHTGFWRRRLEACTREHGATEPAAPAAPAVPAVAAAAMDTSELIEHTLAADMRSRIAALCVRHSVTEPMVLCAAWALALAPRMDTPVILWPGTGRSHAALAPVLGPIDNLLALPCDMTGESSFAAFLTSVRAWLLDAHDHMALPFASAASDLAATPRLATRGPALFWYRGAVPALPARHGGAALRPLGIAGWLPRWPAELHAYERDGALRIQAYALAEGNDSSARPQDMGGQWLQVLERALHTPDMMISDLIKIRDSGYSRGNKRNIAGESNDIADGGKS